MLVLIAACSLPLSHHNHLIAVLLLSSLLSHFHALITTLSLLCYFSHCCSPISLLMSLPSHHRILVAVLTSLPMLPLFSLNPFLSSLLFQLLPTLSFSYLLQPFLLFFSLHPFIYSFTPLFYSFIFFLLFF